MHFRNNFEVSFSNSYSLMLLFHLYSSSYAADYKRSRKNAINFHASKRSKKLTVVFHTKKFF